MRKFLILTLLCLSFSANAQTNAPVGYGTNPELPAPSSSLIPTTNIAKVIGWAEGAKPTAASGLAVNLFAKDLDYPRWLYVLPNGDVLVAESRSPRRARRSIIDRVAGYFMRQVKAAGASANRITLLRDADNDGVAELKTAFLENLNSPFGMVLLGETLYVANSDAVVSFPYKAGETRITTAPTLVTKLPGGPLNHHWTKNLVASLDGKRLYASVGSNSNIGENGMQAEEMRAAILEYNLESKQLRVFASGLRNPVGMAWQPETGELWTVVNERDMLGDDLVPDYMTSVKDGAFYGWPYSYFGQNVDTRVEPARPDLVAKALSPDYALGAHTASLGLAFSGTNALAPSYHGGAFIGQHGSWNRSELAGYKVVFIKFEDGKPQGLPIDVLTGFLNASGQAQGRPAGVAFDIHKNLLVADDAGNVIWRVSAQ